MIEVLVTLVLLALGLIGVIGLQARGQQAELESYQRGQALALLQDMVDRINTDRAAAHALSYVTASPVGGPGALTACGALTGAAYDLCDWGNELTGPPKRQAPAPPEPETAGAVSARCWVRAAALLTPPAPNWPTAPARRRRARGSIR